MDHRTRDRRRMGLATTAAVALLAVLALFPAAAAADTTTLTLIAAPSVIPYNGVSVLTGTLMNTTMITALGGEPILVERAPAATGPWTTLVVITTLNGVPEYYTGTYTLMVMPRDKTYYRMQFQGTPGLDAAVSAAASVTPKVYLSRPSVPRTVRHGQRFRVTCYIQPKHAKGLRTVVRIRFYRYTAGKWVFKYGRWATTSNFLNFTKLTLKTSIKRTGSWRVQAYARPDALHAATNSSFSRVIRVR